MACRRAVVKDAQSRGLPVLDATCPLVSKVHNQGKRYVAHGRKLILIGHAGHPEVEGTMGQVGAPVHSGSVRGRRRRADDPDRHAGRLHHPDDALHRRHQEHHRRAQAQVHRHRRAGDHRHLLRDAESPDRGARAGQGRRRHPGRRREEQFELQPPGRDRPRGRRAELSASPTAASSIRHGSRARTRSASPPAPRRRSSWSRT